jgi:acetoin utilization deacetylase AcuC-like enzyme
MSRRGKRRRNDPGNIVLLFEHADSFLHETSLGNEVHQEGKDRIMAISTALEPLLRNGALEKRVVDTKRPPSEALFTVHARKYVNRLEELAAEALSASVSGSLSPCSHRVRCLTPLLLDAESGSDPIQIGGMTRFSAGSLPAAMRAAAAAVAAVNATLNASRSGSSSTGCGSDRAFCLIRPPGHHATAHGVDLSAGGCGFCILNTVAIAAAHALTLFAGNLKKNGDSDGHSDTETSGGSSVTPGHSRVAIVDFDVHHGNGTEQAVRTLSQKFGSNAILFCSVHLWECFQDSDLDFFPGSGAAEDSESVMNIPLRPLWAEKRVETEDVTGSNLPATTPPALTGRAGWREAIKRHICTALKAFQPSLLLLSAGFDGAVGDEGCQQDGLGGLDLSPEDFEWATNELARATDSSIDGGTRSAIVSVLEGGYGSWDAQLEKYDRSGLARCVAAHVAALAERRPLNGSRHDIPQN